MSKPKTKPDEIIEYANLMFPIGAKVMVLRPNLWFGAAGEVFKHDGSSHWVKIPSKSGDGSYFLCCATLDELKEIKE